MMLKSQKSNFIGLNWFNPYQCHGTLTDMPCCPDGDDACCCHCSQYNWGEKYTSPPPLFFHTQNRSQVAIGHMATNNEWTTDNIKVSNINPPSLLIHMQCRGHVTFGEVAMNDGQHPGEQDGFPPTPFFLTQQTQDNEQTTWTTTNEWWGQRIAMMGGNDMACHPDGDDTGHRHYMHCSHQNFLPSLFTSTCLYSLPHHRSALYHVESLTPCHIDSGNVNSPW